MNRMCHHGPPRMNARTQSLFGLEGTKARRRPSSWDWERRMRTKARGGCDDMDRDGCRDKAVQRLHPLNASDQRGPACLRHSCRPFESAVISPMRPGRIRPKDLNSPPSTRDCYPQPTLDDFFKLRELFAERIVLWGLNEGCTVRTEDLSGASHHVVRATGWRR